MEKSFDEFFLARLKDLAPNLTPAITIIIIIHTVSWTFKLKEPFPSM